MATSRRWALVVGLSLLILVSACVTAWVHRPIETAASSPATVGLAAAPQMAPSQSAPPPGVTSAKIQPSAPQATPPPPPADPPHFDIVRVEPSGDTVVAGKGAPNSKVALLAQGAVVAETTADASGHFVVLPPSLTPGDHSLSLRQTSATGAASASAQSVIVSVPARGSGSVVVALAEPGQATKVLAAPDAPEPPHGVTPEALPSPAVEAVPAPVPNSPPPPATAEATVAVRAVDLENGDGFHASGVAKPGTPLRVYLNNAHIADVVAGQDGQWTVTIKKGLAGGHYVVRADAQRPAEPPRKAPTVTARVEVPFDVPTGAANGPAPTVVTPSVAALEAKAETSVSPPDARVPDARRPVATADSGNAVIEEIQTARVVNGDNLWNISLSRLGQATRYTQIYAANEKQIRDPNLIYPGQVFVLPR